jgi:hypothetical protein
MQQGTKDGLTAFVLLQIYFSGAFAKSRKATVSFVMSVCSSVRLSVQPSAWRTSALSERILFKLDIWAFFENLSKKFKFD